jgi:DNA-binding NtrC family response regulator
MGLDALVSQDNDMDVLIVESQPDLAGVWQAHLQRQGHKTEIATTADAAVAAVGRRDFDAMIVNLMLSDGSALGLADYIRYRRPDANVVFVTDTTFFSDGSLFAHSPNVRAYVATSTPPDDLVALVEHYGSHPVTPN